MTNEELLALATRNEPHTDEERVTILTGLKALPVEEVHNILLEINKASGEGKESLMRFLGDDNDLYEKVATYVREKFTGEAEAAEETEKEDFEDDDFELTEGNDDDDDSDE